MKLVLIGIVLTVLAFVAGAGIYHLVMVVRRRQAFKGLIDAFEQFLAEHERDFFVPGTREKLEELLEACYGPDSLGMKHSDDIAKLAFEYELVLIKRQMELSKAGLEPIPAIPPHFVVLAQGFNPSSMSLHGMQARIYHLAEQGLKILESTSERERKDMFWAKYALRLKVFVEAMGGREVAVSYLPALSRY